MSLLIIEGLKIYGFEPPGEDAIVDFVDMGLELSNTKRAENLALLIREEIGIYRFGPMWAEYRIVLQDQREVRLQSSDRALVINIYPALTCPLSTDVYWDRTRQIVNTFDVWDPENHKMQMYYQVSEAVRCIPGTLTPWHVSRDFAAVLGRIEQAIE